MVVHILDDVLEAQLVENVKEVVLLVATHLVQDDSEESNEGVRRPAKERNDRLETKRLQERTVDSQERGVPGEFLVKAGDKRNVTDYGEVGYRRRGGDRGS